MVLTDVALLVFWRAGAGPQLGRAALALWAPILSPRRCLASLAPLYLTRLLTAPAAGPAMYTFDI